MDMDSEEVPMKCRKCRFVLLKHPEVRVEDSHGKSLGPKDPRDIDKLPACNSEVWYIPEESMPEWMNTNIDKGQWVKGKINCPKCDARIGSYCFVSGFKCPCGSQVVPPIHIVKSKVDFTNTFHIAPTEEPSSSGAEAVMMPDTIRDGNGN